MVSPSSPEVFILGITQNGKTFRPSDWAERLAGVMSQFRPGGVRPGSHLGYSPWCVPTTMNGAKCVIVKRELQAQSFVRRDGESLRQIGTAPIDELVARGVFAPA